MTSNGFAAFSLDHESVAPVDGLPHTLGAWFRLRFATSVDCSPPRACYAASQRSYYHLNCHTGHVRLVERQFLDLNDNVLRRDEFLPWYYIPPAGGVEHHGLAAACVHYRSQFPGWWLGVPYPP